MNILRIFIKCARTYLVNLNNIISASLTAYLGLSNYLCTFDLIGEKRLLQVAILRELSYILCCVQIDLTFWVRLNSYTSTIQLQL